MSWIKICARLNKRSVVIYGVYLRVVRPGALRVPEKSVRFDFGFNENNQRCVLLLCAAIPFILDVSLHLWEYMDATAGVTQGEVQHWSFVVLILCAFLVFTAGEVRRCLSLVDRGAGACANTTWSLSTVGHCVRANPKSCDYPKT